MEAIVKFWNAEKQFGFAITDDGKEFYIRAGGFVRPATAARSGLLHWVDLEGKRIRFDRATKSPEAAWTRMLNEGKLRDANVDTRNPRPPRLLRERPVATNVAVIEEKS
jgi:cold shock CspA family protein